MPDKAGGVLDFSIGTLSARSWPQIEQVWLYMAAGFAAAMLMSNKLNILALGRRSRDRAGDAGRTHPPSAAGDRRAAGGGFSQRRGAARLRRLIAPHIVRILIGSDNRYLLPGAALFGALMVVACRHRRRMAMEPV